MTHKQYSQLTGIIQMYYYRFMSHLNNEILLTNIYWHGTPQTHKLHLY